MIYEDSNNTREKLLELGKSNICAVCEGGLDVLFDADKGKAFLACRNDLSHQGIERIYEPTPFEKEGYSAFNISTRRKMMQEDYGPQTTKLAKYEGVVSLTRTQAMEVLRTIWPNAPDNEVVKAAIICHQYGLNPLMKHVFLIPFKRRKEGKVVGEDWATVLGINTNRLVAQRSHNYSYLDLSPRRMTDEEQEKVLGELDDSRIWAITKIKDMATGAEAMGVGSWPKDEVPHGVEKGNTKLNMACIRSERQALDRQYPGEMPQGVEVIDEQYAPVTMTKPEVKEDVEPAAAKTKKQTKKETVAAGEAVSETKERENSGEECAARDPNLIKNFGDLYPACSEDFGLKTRQAVWDELNVESQEEITELPRDCYRRIAKTRGTSPLP